MTFRRGQLSAGNSNKQASMHTVKEMRDKNFENLREREMMCSTLTPKRRKQDQVNFKNVI